MQQPNTHPDIWHHASCWAVMILLALLFTACDVPGSSVLVPEEVAAHTSVPPSLMPGDWSTYLADDAHSGFNRAETTINPTTAPRLKLHWMYHAHDGISVQPVEANGMIYWGSWDGVEHATDVQGHEIWAANLGRTRGCIRTAGVGSTATVASMTIGGTKTLVVFVGGGNAHFYALNASNGEVIWQTSLSSSPGAFIWSSSVFYRGSIYIGMASLANCPSVQGQLFQLNAATGVVQHVFNVVPNGCLGGGVWSTPTIDTSTGELYLATGSPDTCTMNERYAIAMIELHASNLKLSGSWQIPRSQWVDDSDFGSAPILFTAKLGGVSRPLVGAADKNGRYYAFLRGAISAGPVWTKQIAKGGGCPECGLGSIAPSSWDGSTLYVAGGHTTIHGTNCQGSVRALNPATGAFLWEHCLTGGPVLAAVTGVPGVLVVEEGRTFVVIEAVTGKTLFSYTDAKQITVFYGSASISNGVLYVGSFDGNLYAFGPS